MPACSKNRHQRHNDNTAAELLGDLIDFSTPDAINALLGNLVRQLTASASRRLDAIAIAYVAQLLLGSISSMDRHDAALRTAEDANADDFPTRIVFDRPTGNCDPTRPVRPPTRPRTRSESPPHLGARPTSGPTKTPKGEHDHGSPFSLLTFVNQPNEVRDLLFPCLVPHFQLSTVDCRLAGSPTP